jgi:CRP/FNR family transcriptional regulator
MPELTAGRLATLDVLAGLPEPTLAWLVSHARVIEAPAGARLFGPGRPPEAMLLLLAGRVRVVQMSEQGRELVLYRIAPGETCVLTTACLLSHDDYMAHGYAETAVEALALPRPAFEELVEESTEFRRFVFQAFSRRMTDIFRVIEDVAFARLDVRLAQRLLALAGGEASLMITHQQLAAELGTAREVVSRQLQEFQRRGLIEVARGEVRLSDAAALKKLADSP